MHALLHAILRSCNFFLWVKVYETYFRALSRSEVAAALFAMLCHMALAR